MKIAVNTRLLLPGKLDGIGWFSCQTLKRLTEAHPEHEFVFLFDRPFDSQFIFHKNVSALIVSPPTRHPVLWYIWLEWRLPKVLKKIKADVFLSPDGFIPLKLKIPVVTVIHDINFHHRPLDLPLTSRLYYRCFFPKFAASATRIATVSEYSKRDICESYYIDRAKVDVVYNGSHELYRPITEDEKQQVKQQYTGGANYFIFIGSLHPRKNIDGLLKGFDLYKKRNASHFKLLIVGEKFFLNKQLESAFQAMDYKNDVVFTGRKEPEELWHLLAAAWALTFVPHFEGFGIPLLEAMYCNVPSVASGVTSIPEVAGNTAIYVNPDDANSISLGMEQMASDSELRGQLIANCKVQRQMFSWDKTSGKLWDTIAQSFQKR